MAEEILVGKNDKKIFAFSVSDASKRGSRSKYENKRT